MSALFQRKAAGSAAANGEGSHLLAADASKLRHADDESERGAFSDARNAEHQVETMREIMVAAQHFDDA